MNPNDFKEKEQDIIYIKECLHRYTVLASLYDSLNHEYFRFYYESLDVNFCNFYIETGTFSASKNPITLSLGSYKNVSKYFANKLGEYQIKEKLSNNNATLIMYKNKDFNITAGKNRSTLKEFIASLELLEKYIKI